MGREITLTETEQKIYDAYTLVREFPPPEDRKPGEPALSFRPMFSVGVQSFTLTESGSGLEAEERANWYRAMAAKALAAMFRELVNPGIEPRRYELHERPHESGEGVCYEIHDEEPDQGCHRVELTTDYEDAALRFLAFLNREKQDSD